MKYLEKVMSRTWDTKVVILRTVQPKINEQINGPEWYNGNGTPFPLVDRKNDVGSTDGVTSTSQL